ncbi:FadR/GntR family transcriptional regulator [Glutamicibacter sp. Je.9.36]|uniref:FadR/GntR family transcriptional regulator n=1 Tax=Glutamicibacter sp. Je.9.36 TaxID=3142837 RepID=UPI003DA9CEF3
MAVTDAAITHIKDMILNGALSPGDRLPPEKELSEKLGLSRSSLREAVKALELIRVLDVRRGDGTYVTSLEPGLLAEAMGFVVDLHRDSSVLELLEVRRILEPSCAGLAAQRRLDEHLELLDASIAKVNAGTDLPSLIEHDLEFHAIIAEAAKNSYLATLLEALSSKTVRARVWRGLTQDHAVQRTLDEHQAIVSAIRDSDTDLAKALVTAHISGVENWLRRSTT